MNIQEGNILIAKFTELVTIDKFNRFINNELSYSNYTLGDFIISQIGCISIIDNYKKFMMQPPDLDVILKYFSNWRYLEEKEGIEEILTKGSLEVHTKFNWKIPFLKLKYFKNYNTFNGLSNQYTFKVNDLFKKYLIEI